MATKCFLGKATHEMGKIPKGYRIQVPSTQGSRPSEKELKKALEDAGFDLKGWFNRTSAACSPFNWEWSK